MQQNEVISEFYQVHIERGQLTPEDVPFAQEMAEEWKVSRRTAERARERLMKFGHAVGAPSNALPIGPITEVDMARFWPHVLPRDAHGCLLWRGVANSSGYPGFDINGRRVGAHRVSYEYRFGPLPPGLEIDHVFERGCRSTLCVNHEHLEAVTPAENNRRRHAAARWMAGIWVRTELDDD